MVPWDTSDDHTLQALVEAACWDATRSATLVEALRVMPDGGASLPELDALQILLVELG